MISLPICLVTRRTQGHYGRGTQHHVILIVDVSSGSVSRPYPGSAASKQRLGLIGGAL